MFEVEKSRINLTISEDVAVAISEVTKCFENEVFDIYSSSDLLELMDTISTMVEAKHTFEIWGDEDNGLDIHIVS